MIVELVVDVLVAFFVFLCSLFPAGGPPAWFRDVGATVNDGLSYASGMGAWVPISLGVAVLGAVLSCMAVGFVVKVVRIVASFITVGGGSAG